MPEPDGPMIPVSSHAWKLPESPFRTCFFSETKQTLLINKSYDISCNKQSIAF